LEDGALACERCGGPLLHRNGRFGLFLACGASPPCGQFENLKHASSRLGDDEGPLCITMELEDVCQVRLYADGARDSACLRAWAAECGLGPEVVAPRDDWVATCSRAVIGAARPGIFADDAGLGLGQEASASDVPQTALADAPSAEVGGTDMGFTSFLFPVEQHAAVVSRLRGVLRLSEEAGGPAARLDPVPEPALRFAAQRSTLAHAGCPDEVDQLLARAMERAPRLRLLQPFQRDGVRRVLQLRGRCLLADEMGCGKTPQALAVLAAYEEWPVLVVCPASMRLAWAEEMERWLPELLRPRNIHVIFTSNDMLPQSRQPGSLGEVRVCIVSLTMARLLHENLSERR